MLCCQRFESVFAFRATPDKVNKTDRLVEQSEIPFARPMKASESCKV